MRGRSLLDVNRSYSSGRLMLWLLCLCYCQGFILVLTENGDTSVQTKKVFLKLTYTQKMILWLSQCVFDSNRKQFARQRQWQFWSINKMEFELWVSHVSAFFLFFCIKIVRFWIVKIRHPHFHSLVISLLRFCSIPHAVFFQRPCRERMLCVWEGRLDLTRSVAVSVWLMWAGVQNETFGLGLAEETKRQTLLERVGVCVCVWMGRTPVSPPMTELWRVAAFEVTWDQILWDLWETKTLGQLLNCWKGKKKKKKTSETRAGKQWV